MTEIRLASLQGEAIVLGSETVTAFRQTVRGDVCLPQEAGYDEARTIWNAMINRRPGAVVRCRGAADIIRAVRFAREHGLLLAVRGGGHNIAGNAVCEGGLLIDLSLMRSVRVDPYSPHCSRRAGRHPRRFRQRGAGLRARHSARHQLDDRRGGTHPRRRVWLAQPQIRTYRRQPDLGRRSDG